jgi:hypothetical protein
MDDGGSSTIRARRLGHRRPVDLDAGRVVRSQGGASGQRSPHEHRRAWQQPTLRAAPVLALASSRALSCDRGSTGAFAVSPGLVTRPRCDTLGSRAAFDLALGPAGSLVHTSRKSEPRPPAALAVRPSDGEAEAAGGAWPCSSQPAAASPRPPRAVHTLPRKGRDLALPTTAPARSSWPSVGESPSAGRSPRPGPGPTWPQRRPGCRPSPRRGGGKPGRTRPARS